MVTALSNRPSNLLVIMSDEHQARISGCYGHPVIRTPNIDALAARGTRFNCRVKLCFAHDCAWAFYDRSRNGSRTWCEMGVCGNRAKARTYRARAGR